MSASRVARSLTMVFVATVVLSGCTSGPAVMIPQAKVYGPQGHRFSVSFLRSPTVSVSSHVNVKSEYRTSVGKRWFWSGGGVLVIVDALNNVPPPKQINPFLRSYLPTSHGGRIISRLGFRAATEIVPCSTPAGSCPGTVATLVLLDHSTIYEVSSSGLSSSGAQKIMSTFRIVN